MAEELERQEADRKLQAEKLKNKMEVRNCVIWVVCGPQYAGTLEIDLIERCVFGDMPPIHQGWVDGGQLAVFCKEINKQVFFNWLPSENVSRPSLVPLVPP